MKTLVTVVERHAGRLLVAYIASYLLVTVPWIRPDLFLEPQVSLESSGAIRMRGRNLVASEPGPAFLNTSAFRDGSFSIELVLVPARLDAIGPARIAAYSQGPEFQNWLVGQHKDALVVRHRGREASFPDVFGCRGRKHLILVLEESGVTLFGSGQHLDSQPWRRRLRSWNERCRFTLGNEVTGDRPWAGELLLFRLFDRRLDQREVQNLFNGNRKSGHLQEATITLAISPPASMKLVNQNGDWVPLHRYESPWTFKLERVFGREHRRLLRSGGDLLRNLLGTLPLGVLLAARLRRWRPVRLLLATVSLQLALSLFSESMQFLSTYRTADSVDVALNVAGAALGVATWLLIVEMRGE